MGGSTLTHGLGSASRPPTRARGHSRSAEQESAERLTPDARGGRPPASGVSTERTRIGRGEGPGDGTPLCPRRGGYAAHVRRGLRALDPAQPTQARRGGPSYPTTRRRRPGEWELRRGASRRARAARTSGKEAARRRSVWRIGGDDDPGRGGRCMSAPDRWPGGRGGENATAVREGVQRQRGLTPSDSKAAPGRGVRSLEGWGRGGLARMDATREGRTSRTRRPRGKGETARSRDTWTNGDRRLMSRLADGRGRAREAWRSPAPLGAGAPGLVTARAGLTTRARRCERPSDYASFPRRGVSAFRGRATAAATIEEGRRRATDRGLANRDAAVRAGAAEEASFASADESALAHAGE